ncbi:MAG: hypothetical protein P0Y59_11590 [Candidatus Sphingomonas phytovorans]|nr:hypothetical protein [Sphingomonas sp.]WEK02289.1 MAG: hypothetical protein P0Y59_11590 [Sphingomonas sp.]
MTVLPAWMAQFDGTAIEDKTGVSAILATAGDGWPHVAYLSGGEILAVSPDQIRLYLWPASGTAQNLKASGRASLHSATGGIVWEARLTTSRLLADDRTFMAEMCVVDTIRHRAPYADVRAMIDFELADAASTLERWRGQIARLGAFVQ